MISILESLDHNSASPSPLATKLTVKHVYFPIRWHSLSIFSLEDFVFIIKVTDDLFSWANRPSSRTVQVPKPTTVSTHFSPSFVFSKIKSSSLTSLIMHCFFFLLSDKSFCIVKPSRLCTKVFGIPECSRVRAFLFYFLRPLLRLGLKFMRLGLWPIGFACTSTGVGPIWAFLSTSIRFWGVMGWVACFLGVR